jgi:toxin ParE1/3/4
VKQRQVTVSRQATEDITTIYHHTFQAAGSKVADEYIQRLETFISGFAFAAERGTLRSDIRPNLRVIGFEKRIAIAFKVKDDRVEILRCFWGGQNWEEKI